MPTLTEVSIGSTGRKAYPLVYVLVYVLVFLSLPTHQILHSFFLLTGFPLILYISQNDSYYRHVTY